MRESIEDVRQVFLGHADTGIVDGKAQGRFPVEAGAFIDREGDGTIGRREFDGIA